LGRLARESSCILQYTFPNNNYRVLTVYQGKIHNNSPNILHQNQFTHGHVRSRTITKFKGSGAAANGFTGIKKMCQCCGSVYAIAADCARVFKYPHR